LLEFITQMLPFRVLH